VGYKSKSKFTCVIIFNLACRVGVKLENFMSLFNLEMDGEYKIFYPFPLINNSG
jgi:hypothetical protein